MTSWDVWLELDKPQQVIFHSLTGPDADLGNPQKIEASGDLPRLVHNGDKFANKD